MLERIEKPWGYEIIWAKTDKYVGKILHIEEGKRLSLQFHHKKDETIHVHFGQIKFTFGDKICDLKEIVLNPGDSFHILPGQIHRMEALKTSDVYEVSTPELDDIERISDDFGR
jgi:mannose-6-phosphate isomerase